MVKEGSKKRRKNDSGSGKCVDCEERSRVPSAAGVCIANSLYFSMAVLNFAFRMKIKCDRKVRRPSRLSYML